MTCPRCEDTEFLLDHGEREESIAVRLVTSVSPARARDALRRHLVRHSRYASLTDLTDSTDRNFDDQTRHAALRPLRRMHRTPRRHAAPPVTSGASVMSVEEPKNLGAVVEAKPNNCYARHFLTRARLGNYRSWVLNATGGRYDWCELRDPVVLHEGWTPPTPEPTGWGAVCERSVVHLADSLGLSGVRVIRTATSRDDDPGDVHIGRHIVLQVKGGAAAKDAGWKLRRRWYAEARDQADTVQESDGRMRVPILACQRRGTPQHRADDWIAVVWLPDLMWMHDPYRYSDSDLPDVIVEMRLADLLGVMA